MFGLDLVYIHTFIYIHTYIHIGSRSGGKQLSLKDIEYHEINEAFSVVALANAKYVHMCI